MKIVHITPSYKPAFIYGGPIQSVGKLCEVLVKAISSDDDTLEVLTTTANGKQELDVEAAKQQIVDGVPVTYFKRLTKDHSHFSPALLLGLKNLIRRSGQNKMVIHIHAWWNLVSVLSCALAKLYQIPVILSPRGMLTSYTQTNRNSLAKKIIHQTIGKKLLRYCHIHATSEQEKQEILAIVKPRSITVIPNLVSFPDEAPQKAEKNTNTAFKLIFLSRIEEKKGLDLLFEALAITDFDWELTIAGTGNTNYIDTLKLKAQNLNLTTRIKWLGQVANEAKFNLLADHDLCVLTSYNENFANVIIESLSVGTAVLVSDKVGLANYVKDRDLGWITPLEVQQIALTLQKAAHNRWKLNQIGTTAAAAIRTDFSDQKLVHDYLNLYHNQGNFSE